MRSVVLTLLTLTLVHGIANRCAADSPKPLRLIFITCSVEAKFFEPVKKGMRDASEQLGVSSEFIGTVGVDFPKQAEMVRQAVKDGYDGIALNLVHPEAFDQVVAEAIQVGVPVVGFNTDDRGTENARLSCVSPLLYEAGRHLGETVLDQIPKGSHVLMTMHDPGISSLENRLRGEQDVLKTKNIKWTVINTGTDAAEGARKITETLRQNPEIHVVMATGQADTEAAGRAIAENFSEEQANRKYWAAGFDLSPKTLELIQSGHIRCTVDQQPYVQGFYPVVQLTHYLRHGIMPSDVESGAAIIDVENVDQAIAGTKANYR
ncbi:substrate-binding domain-containing protein [Novipirellula herctigrandis]